MASCVSLCVPMATYHRHPLALLTLPRSLSHLLPRSVVLCPTTTRSLANTLCSCWPRANRNRQVRTLPLPAQMPSAPTRHRHRQPSPRRILCASLNLPTTPPPLQPLSNAVGMRKEMQRMCWNSVWQDNYQATASSSGGLYFYFYFLRQRTRK